MQADDAQTSQWLPGDGGLRRQDGGDEVGPLWAVLLVLRPQLILRLQPPTHRLGGRGKGTRRPLGLQSEWTKGKA